MKKIAIICSGGDVSGMNAALKRFVEYALYRGLQPYFVHNGYEGLIDDEITPADYRDVAGIITRGGTKIGSSRSKRFMDAAYRKTAIANLHQKGIEALVVLGGDGSFKGMHRLVEESDMAFCGIPATIDNDIAGTDYSLGVDTALNIIKNAIDSIRDTASSFRRAFVIETMGRNCGYLALVSALTSGAEMCLIPEIHYDMDAYKKRFKNEIEEGRSYFIAVVSEALKNSDTIAQWFEKEVGMESRVTVLGHIQRGGNTTVHDRLMAYRFVTHAVDSLLEGKESGVVCYHDGGFDIKTVSEVVSSRYAIPSELLQLGEEYNRR
jgi:6-phosphofructokinase 1